MRVASVPHPACVREKHRHVTACLSAPGAPAHGATAAARWRAARGDRRGHGLRGPGAPDPRVQGGVRYRARDVPPGDHAAADGLSNDRLATIFEIGFFAPTRA